VKRLVLGSLLVIATVLSAAHAQVRIDIGIQLPGPPGLVVIPGMPVYYAPRASANVFFYAHQYWAFSNGGWYVGSAWNGPWVVVAPPHIPAPILQVPVRFYPAPPPPWRDWRRDAPPRWESHYGREWREEAYQRDWREHEERWEGGKERGKGKGCPPGLAKQGRC
jgi:hypothetical protein